MRGKLVKQGVVRQLVDVSQKFATDSGGREQVAVARAVANLGKSTALDSRRQFVRDGGLEPLLHLVRSRRLADQKAGAEALVHVMHRNGLAQEQVHQAGFGPTLKGLAVSADPQTQVFAMRSLSEMAMRPHIWPELAKDKGMAELLERNVASELDSVVMEAERTRRLLGQDAGTQRWRAEQPNENRNVRILSLDGGGTRAVVAIEILKELRAISGHEIHELFDMICGTSTGAILAFMIGLRKLSLEETGQLYADLAPKIFPQGIVNKLMAGVQGGTLYDPSHMEHCLRDVTGDTAMLDHDATPLVFACAAQTQVQPPVPFLFRNYSHSPDRPSRYAGSTEYALWEGLRATTAAPTYFPEFLLDEYVLRDGAVVSNNPAAIAVHEARRLWGKDSVKTICSVGTGLFPTLFQSGRGLREAIRSIVHSATSTELTHHVLDDLLSSSTYFRFNPSIADEVYLDEIDPVKLRELQMIARDYVSQPHVQARMRQLVETLVPPKRTLRTRLDELRDWVKVKSNL